MHWGKTKVPESETLIKRKQHLEQTKIDLKIASKEYNKESQGGYVIPSKKTTLNLSNATIANKHAKEDVKSTRILDALQGVEKSKSQIKHEARYKQQGMSDDEAAVAAYKYIKTRNMLAAIGTTVVLSGGAYAAYKIHDDRVDKIIKQGTILSHISSNDTVGVRDAFYSTKESQGRGLRDIKDTLDNSKYKGIFAHNTAAWFNQTPYEKRVKILKDVKVASPENARKALDEMVKNNPDLAEKIHAYAKTNNLSSSWPDVKKLNAKTKTAMRGANPTVTKDVYKLLNAALVDHSPAGQELNDKFYEALSKKGYNAVKDHTDSAMSGFKTFNPIITFNAKGLVDVIDVTEMSREVIDRNYKTAYRHLNTDAALKTGRQTTGMVLGVIGTKKLLNASQDQDLSKRAKVYLKANPNTQMSFTEIKRKLESEDLK